jgi:hypothetical protein
MEEYFVGSPRYAEEGSASEGEEKNGINPKTHANTLCGQKLEFCNVKAVVFKGTAVLYLL